MQDDRAKDIQSVKSGSGYILGAFLLGGLLGLFEGSLISAGIPDSRGGSLWEVDTTDTFELQFFRQATSAEVSARAAIPGSYTELLEDGRSGVPLGISVKAICAGQGDGPAQMATTARRVASGSPAVAARADGVVRLAEQCRRTGPSLYRDHYEPPVLKLELELTRPDAPSPSTGGQAVRLELLVEHHVGDVGEQASLSRITCQDSGHCTSTLLRGAVLVGNVHYNPCHYGETLDTDDPLAGGMAAQARIILPDQEIARLFPDGSGTASPQSQHPAH